MMTLIELIKQQIRTKGQLPFVQYMQLALYAPQVGYYRSSLPKFGASGDFITAPELTPLFGQALGNQCEAVLRVCSNPAVLEFGAGSGRLCSSLLRQLQELNCVPTAYYILELSAELQRRQKNYLQAELPELFDRIHWISTWPEQPFQGVMIANEVLDAMPVHRFMQTDSGIFESMITLDVNDNLQEIFEPCKDKRLHQYIQRVLPSSYSHYQSEANLWIDDWIKQCAQCLQKGAIFIIDYGFPRHEYYHPDRNQGTLMCHYRQKTHSNPLAHPGEEDITAHVDFTHVAEAAFAAGFDITGFTNQAAFLLANDILKSLAAIEGNVTYFNAQQAVKQLVQSHEMGELFKVIALTKDLDIPLQGFSLSDKRVSL